MGVRANGRPFFHVCEIFHMKFCKCRTNIVSLQQKKTQSIINILICNDGQEEENSARFRVH